MARMIDLEALLKGCGDDSFDDGIRIDTELVPLAGPGGPVKPAVYEGGTYQQDGRIPDFPVTRSHPPASWPSAANSSICRTYRKTAGEESRRRSPVANRWMRP